MTMLPPTLVLLKSSARRTPAPEDLPASDYPPAGPDYPPAAPGRDDEVLRALRRGLDQLAALQGPDGAWRGDYGGPMFLLPMYVAARHIIGRPIPRLQRVGMIAYLRAAQNPDGSIGLHIEGRGSQFATVLGYVALRLLGVARDDRDVLRLRSWLRPDGGALGCASWGKFVLALLGLYEYEGLHPVQPELWLLPDAAPMHPRRLWCHCRQVYLPMAWLYGMRARAADDALLGELRQELYNEPYERIRWREQRDRVATSDQRFPSHALLRWANRALSVYEDRHSPTLRRRALSRVLEHIQVEDRATSFLRIGPVNAVLNTLVHHFRGAAGRVELERSLAALEGYLFAGHDGVKMNGYNSSALWDTAFAVQTVLASPLAGEHRELLSRAHDFIRDNQVLEDVPDHDRYYRHRSRGGWPFSDRAHGWPISDCTAEGLECALALEQHVAHPVPEPRLIDAVELLLSFQNADGGWATYELTRGGTWLELLNPSQVFGDIMIDYSYVECTAACMQTLVQARRRFPGRFDARIERAVHRGERFLRKQQRDDGSFEGSWGVCFTYGTWFGVEGLLAAGAATHDPAIQRACSFLRGQQRADGGWGESGESCAQRHYVEHDESQVVNTAWALLTLARAGQSSEPAAARAARWLLERQQPDGDWPRQSLSGVFNKTVLINYEYYRRYFPLWALSAYRAARAPQGVFAW